MLGPLGNGLIRITDHENLGVDTTSFHLSCIIFELGLGLVGLSHWYRTIGGFRELGVQNIGKVNVSPAAGQQDLSVHFDGGLSAELSAGKIGVVRRADVVMRHRLVHVLVDV